MSRFKRILIVDDNQTNLAILTELLECDFSLRTACGGKEALRTAEQFEPGVILLDVMMPGVDGYETCRRMRAMPSLYDAVIIMLSAKAMPSEQAAGMEAGADDYVTKPFDDGELMAIIRTHARVGFGPECPPTKPAGDGLQWKTRIREASRQFSDPLKPREVGS